MLKIIKKLIREAKWLNKYLSVLIATTDFMNLIQIKYVCIATH
jgi:hypothetical protein